MFKIHLKRLAKAITNKEGESILDTLTTNQVEHPHPCGGKARCSTCRVIVYDGIENCHPRNKLEQIMAERLGFNKDVRLACQTKIKGDIKIRRPVYDRTDIAVAANTAGSGQGHNTGKEKQVTALFCDISDYTKFTDRNPPYDVVHILNRYYFVIESIVTRNKGIIIDIYGDGFLAIFGTQEDFGHEKQAVTAAVEITEMIRTEFNEYLSQYFGQTFCVRIGIDSGPVILGSINLNSQKKFVAVGDTVNVASRIEQANKETGTTILVSESTHQQLDDSFLIGKSFGIKVKGKEEELNLVEVVDKVK